MRTYNRIIRNGIGLMLAVTALLVMLALVPQDAFAAGTVTVKYDPEAETGNTTFSLYKVGRFGENGTFAFIEPFSDNISEVPNYKMKDYDDENEWAEKWMDSANVVSEYIKNEGIKPVEAKTVSAADSASGFTFDTVLENGFYLITGTSSKAEDGNGNITYYWPRPMYVMVLNDDPSYVMKPASGLARRLTVVKQWVGDEDVRELARPGKVTLHRTYDGMDRGDIVLPVIDEQGNEQWFFTWETEQGEEDPEKWAVTEDLNDERIRANYTVIDSDRFTEGAGAWTKTITNTFDRQQLEIKKILKDYISHKDASTQAFLFEVTGYIGGSTAFHKFTAITFGDESGDSDTTLVKNIPRDVDRIVVKEVQSGNYKPEGSAEKEAERAVSEEGRPIWTVSFTNVLDNDDTFDTGVINKYSITGNGVFSFEGKTGR